MYVTISRLVMWYAAHTRRQVVIPIPWMPKSNTVGSAPQAL